MKEPHLVLGLGELLWDVLPEGPRLGGAPANFAVMAGRLGNHAALLSRIGRDDLGSLELHIDDDGPGLTSAEIEEVTARGHRLDETKPGSGLGLSIVTDLVSMYRGNLRFGRARAGGLCAHVDLPAA